MSDPTKGNARRQPGEATNQNIKPVHSTKKACILAVLRTRTLNRFEAERFGDHCLHSTIAELRRDGCEFFGQMETVSTRLPERCSRQALRLNTWTGGPSMSVIAFLLVHAWRWLRGAR